MTERDPDLREYGRGNVEWLKPPVPSGRGKRRGVRVKVSRPLRNVAWGIGWGLCFAAGLSLWVALMYALLGAEVLDRDGYTYWGTVRGYVVAGVAVGSTAGLFRRLLRSRLGTFAVGCWAGVVAYAAFATGIEGGLQWIRHENWQVTVESLVLTGVVGGGAGALFLRWSLAKVNARIDRVFLESE